MTDDRQPLTREQIEWLRLHWKFLSDERGLYGDRLLDLALLALPVVAGTHVIVERDYIRKLEEALHWYGEKARLVRLIHSEGDTGRQALAADGGGRSKTALEEKP